MRTSLFLPAIFLVTPAFSQNAYTAPDFSGVWVRDFFVSNLLDVPESGPGPVLQDPRYPKTDHNGVPRLELSEEELARVIRFTTNWVPDPTNPILQPQTRAALEEIAEQELAGTPHPEMQTLCKPSGVPHIVNILNNTIVLQTPTEVIFLYERDHQVRHVYLNRSHEANPGREWYGDSVGHYEGDTLVVDTIGMNDETHIDRFATPHSDKIHVVERYRFSENGNFQATVIVEDPVAFTTAWTGVANYRRAPGNAWSENVCGENNQREFWPGHILPVAVDNSLDF
jgi:hypothetical protein